MWISDWSWISFLPEVSFRNSAVWPSGKDTLKSCNVILETEYFSSCIIWFAESLAGKRADLACMEKPSWKVGFMQSYLWLNKLAILCFFPKHGYLFAFPKWSCFNILQQPTAVCLAMYPFCQAGNYQYSLTKKWLKHYISLASLLIFGFDGIVSHTIQLSYSSVYSTCGTECFLFSLPCVLSFVTFWILLFTWMREASLWVSDFMISSGQYWQSCFPSSFQYPLFVTALRASFPLSFPHLDVIQTIPGFCHLHCWHLRRCLRLRTPSRSLFPSLSLGRTVLKSLHGRRLLLGECDITL